MNANTIKLAVALTASYQLLKIKRLQIQRNKKRTARFWVNPYLRERNTKGRFAKDVSNFLRNCEFVLINLFKIFNSLRI